MSAALSTAAFAVEKEGQTYNEYDMIIQARAKAQSEAHTASEESGDNGYQNAEQAYLERAALPVQTLKDMGYTQEQIDILKAYDGGPLEEHPELAAASSALTITSSKLVMSKTRAGAQFKWSWSSFPVYHGKDAIAVAWIGTSKEGLTLNANLDTSNSITVVEYYIGAANVVNSTEKPELKTPGTSKKYFSCDVPLTIGASNGSVAYARSGYVKAYANTVAGTTGEFQEFDFVFEYAHSSYTLNLDWSFAVDSNGGISISVTPSLKDKVTEYVSGISMNLNGTVTRS